MKGKALKNLSTDKLIERGEFAKKELDLYTSELEYYKDVIKGVKAKVYGRKQKLNAIVNEMKKRIETPKE